MTKEDQLKQDRSEKEAMKFLEGELAKYPSAPYVPAYFEAELYEHLNQIEEAQNEHDMSLEEVAAGTILKAFIEKLLAEKERVTREEERKRIEKVLRAAHKHGDDRDSNWESCMERIFNENPNE